MPTLAAEGFLDVHAASTAWTCGPVKLSRSLIGNAGNGWIAMTVRVPSGRRVTLGQLFRDPLIALPVLGRAWLSRLSEGKREFCVMDFLSDQTPTSSSE